MNAKMKTESSSSSNADRKKDSENGEIAKTKSETNPEDQEKLDENSDSVRSKSPLEEKSVEPKSKTEVTTESESSRETEAADVVKDDSEETRKQNEETDKKDGEEKDEGENISSASKLEADALSASLSSSRCLLKRNRGDLDTDSDSEDKHEEPDSKKSHTAHRKEEEEVGEDEVGDGLKSMPAPVVVSKSKLSSSELVASMSSSKSVLKRGIEQVEDTSCHDNEEAPEPEVKVKKSLTRDTQPVPPEPPVSKKLVEEAKEKVKSPETNRATERLLYNVKSSVISPLKSESPLMESTRLNSPESCKSKSISEANPLRATPIKSVLSPKESVRVIAAKDLEEDRKLERKRLNKMLLIFPDQKPV